MQSIYPLLVLIQQCTCPELVRIYMTTRHGALITEPAITGITAAELTPIGRIKTGLDWLLFKRGPGVSNHFEVGAFLSLASAEMRPDLQLECIAMRGDFAPEGIKIDPGFQCFASLQRPKSRGHLWLDSKNPQSPPKFRFNYLSDASDRNLAIDS